MKEIIKNNKSIFIVFIGIILLVIVAIILIISSNKKTFDLSEVSKQFTKYYSDIHLEELEKENIDYYFSLPSSELDEALLLSNFNPNELDSESEDSPCLLLVLNNLSKEDINEYYEALNAFVISYDNVEDNNELVSLYKKSILMKGKNYIYFIMGNNNKVMEKELLRLYK